MNKEDIKGKKYKVINREKILEKALEMAVEDMNDYLERFTNGVFLRHNTQEYIYFAEKNEEKGE